MTKTCLFTYSLEELQARRERCWQAPWKWWKSASKRIRGAIRSTRVQAAVPLHRQCRVRATAHHRQMVGAEAAEVGPLTSSQPPRAFTRRRARPLTTTPQRHRGRQRAASSPTWTSCWGTITATSTSSSIITRNRSTRALFSSSRGLLLPTRPLPPLLLIPPRATVEAFFSSFDRSLRTRAFEHCSKA